MTVFVLVDPPVTPYSPRDDVVRWAGECRQAVLDNPGSAAWREALDYAESLLNEPTKEPGAAR